MLVPWLFLCAYCKKKIILLISTYFLFVIFFAYGWRFIIYIVSISGAIVYSRCNNYKIAIRHIAIGIVALFVYSTITGMVRMSMRKGEITYIEKIEYGDFVYTLESNFDIYKTFYGIVNTYPEKYDYYYGEALIGSPIIMWIPRIIWKEKPRGGEYPLTIAIQKACGPDALFASAMSSPNITEYYLDFGSIGIFLFSFLLGRICQKMLSLYYSDSIFDLIKYALFCGFLVQLINRGYMAQLITLAFFLYIPLVLYRKFKYD